MSSSSSHCSRDSSDEAYQVLYDSVSSNLTAERSSSRDGGIAWPYMYEPDVSESDNNARDHDKTEGEEHLCNTDW